MRLKTFHGKDLNEAMTHVRDQLGADAIIVATQEAEDGGGARVTAAVEYEEEGFDLDSDAASDATLEKLTTLLELHGVPHALTDRVVDTAADGSEDSVSLCLQQALERMFRFEPVLKPGGQNRYMLVGPPGTGKTVTCAKLAALCVLEGERAVLIAADPIRLTATEQLTAYAERLGVPIFEAPDAASLADALARCRPEEHVFIDTPGTNPYNLEELAHLVELRETADIEPVLVCNAGRDAEDAADIAKAFRPLGTKTMIATGLDLAHRLGALLAVANTADLAFGEFSATPNIAHGLDGLTAEKLVQRLTPLGRKAADDNDGETADESAASSEA